MWLGVFVAWVPHNKRCHEHGPRDRAVTNVTSEPRARPFREVCQGEKVVEVVELRLLCKPNLTAFSVLRSLLEGIHNLHWLISWAFEFLSVLCAASCQRYQVMCVLDTLEVGLLKVNGNQTTAYSRATWHAVPSHSDTHKEVEFLFWQKWEAWIAQRDWKVLRCSQHTSDVYKMVSVIVQLEDSFHVLYRAYPSDSNATLLWASMVFFFPVQQPLRCFKVRFGNPNCRWDQSKKRALFQTGKDGGDSGFYFICF